MLRLESWLSQWGCKWSGMGQAGWSNSRKDVYVNDVRSVGSLLSGLVAFVRSGRRYYAGHGNRSFLKTGAVYARG